MKVAVFGAGAVGGQIALRLAQGGCETAVVARGAQLEAIKNKGLTLTANGSTVTYRLAATSDARTLGLQDVVFIAVKGPALASAVPDIASLVGPKTRVVFAMNGVPWWFAEGNDAIGPALRGYLDPGGVVASLVPLDRLVWSMVMVGGALTAPGVIVNPVPGPGSLAIGYPDGHVDAALEQVREALIQGGIQATIETAIREKIWFKLLMNAGQAMVATASERDAVQTVSDPELRAIVVACMNEILEIGKAIGIDLKADPVAMTEPSRHSTHRSSFLQDLKAGRPLELASTILAVRHIARLTGVAIPHLATVAAIVSARSTDLARPAE